MKATSSVRPWPGTTDTVGGWLCFVAVLNSYRRQSVGTLLVRDAERRLQAMGCFKINLQSERRTQSSSLSTSVSVRRRGPCEPRKAISSIRVATCSCGNLRVECYAGPTKISSSHCPACQKRTGSTYGIATFFAREAIRIKGPVNIYAPTPDDERHVTYYFCPNCGSTVYWEPGGCRSDWRCSRSVRGSVVPRLRFHFAVALAAKLPLPPSGCCVNIE